MRCHIEGITANIDCGISQLVSRLNRVGFKTSHSCSGLIADHEWRRAKGHPGYLSFEVKDLTEKQIAAIKQASKKAGMYYKYGHYKSHPEIAYGLQYEDFVLVEHGIRIESDEEKRRAWDKFQQELEVSSGK